MGFVTEYIPFLRYGHLGFGFTVGARLAGEGVLADGDCLSGVLAGAVTTTMVSLLQRVTWKSPKQPRALCPWRSVHSLMLGIPSLRSCSVGRRDGPSWPSAAKPASLPVYPLRRTSIRPLRGGKNIKSQITTKARRPAGRPVGSLAPSVGGMLAIEPEGTAGCQRSPRLRGRPSRRCDGSTGSLLQDGGTHL